MTGERGAATLSLLAVVGVSMVVAAWVADLGVYFAGGVQAATAADAAALAAAPLTFSTFGGRGNARSEAERFARANGATLLSCSCDPDPSWNPRFVEVIVERRLDLRLLRRRVVRAVGRAEFAPAFLR